MDSPGSQGAPRFSSFRPPAASTPAPAAGLEHEHRRRGHRSRADRRERVDRSESPRRRHRRRSSRDRTNRGTENEESERLVSGEGADERNPANAENDLFVVDVHGDPDITRYGPNKYEVPRYHRTGGGFIIGLPDQRIEYDSRNDDTLVTVPVNASVSSNANLLSSAALSSLSSNVPIRLFNQSDSNNPAADIESSADFISTEVPQSGIGSSALNVDYDAPSYLSIHTYSNDEEAASTEELNEPQVQPAVGEAEVLRRNAELNRAVKRNPKDIKAWVRLAEHQENVTLGMRAHNRALDHNEKRIVASAKLSIYDAALQANPHHPNRDHLVLGRMEQGAIIWDSDKLMSEWGEALFYHSEFISLYIQYLDYCQTDPQNFDFASCFSTYVYCFDLHSRIASTLYKCHTRSYLLLRLTLLLRETGHVEMAVGIWQAVLEFVAFRPATVVHENKEAALETFKELWSPEYVKLGEPGWRAWDTEHAPNSPVDDRVYSSHAEPSNLFETWASAERERTIKSRMPAHAFNLSRKDEAFQVVLRDDCMQILPSFWDLDDKDSLGLLLDGFLQFCHLPHLTVPANMETSRLWTGDNFLRNQFMDDAQSSIADWVHVQENVATTTAQPFAFNYNTFIHTTDTLFADPQLWFSAFAKWAATTTRPSSVIDPNFVLQVLRSLADTVTDSVLAEYVLALSFACNNEEGKKYGRQLLKKRGSDLRLYNAYALMHWRTGNRDVAHRVWATALSMSQDFERRELIETSLLWNSWIWELLNIGGKAQAAHLLQAMPFKHVEMLSYETADAIELTNTNVLRLTRFLSDAQEVCLKSKNFQCYAAYTDCLAICRYLMDAPLSEILEPYTTAALVLKILPRREANIQEFGKELMHQARARMVHHYVSTKSGRYRPIDVRNVLLDSLELWPHNTMFLSLFQWNNARLNFNDRTRDIFDATIGKQAQAMQSVERPQIYRVPITTHLFNIYSEMGRPMLVSSPHAIRAAFERAVSQGPVSHNLTIWKLYFLWELYIENSVPRAREVFFRAVRSCPWSKELYMLAFEHLRTELTERLPACRDNREGERNPPGFNSTELQALYSEMLRRGLRVHHRVEAFWAHREVS